MKTRLIILLSVLLPGTLPAFSQTRTGTPGQHNLMPGIHLKCYADAAKNNVIDGTAYRLGTVSTLSVGDYDTQVGLLWAMLPNQGACFSGWSVQMNGHFRIRKLMAEGGIFYRSNHGLSGIREGNIGVMFGISGKHLSVKFGNNFRIYRYLRIGFTEPKLNDDRCNTIMEPRNLMYSFSWSVKPAGHRWNLLLTITDYDDFLIQQETNPMVSVKVPVSLGSGFTIFGEVWYQSSGLLNLHVNYFGYQLRTGILWKLH